MAAVLQSALSRFNEYKRIKVTSLGRTLGAHVECGDLRTVDDDTISDIRAAWLDHLVLLFRDQQLTIHEQLAFTARLGVCEKSPQAKARHPYISVISNVLENGAPIGSLGDGEAIWHTDMSNREIPPNGSFLYAVEVPPTGGETGFLNMYHALENLPAELRSRVEGLTLHHDGEHNSGGIKRGVVPVHAVHPVIRTHPETAYNTLYLGRRPYARVNGLAAEESDALLDALWAHATRSQFAWEHSWRVGDAILWDNRCAMHHRNPFDPKTRRLMHRSVIAGTRPVNDPHALQGPHPRSLLAL